MLYALHDFVLLQWTRRVELSKAWMGLLVTSAYLAVTFGMYHERAHVSHAVLQWCGHALAAYYFLDSYLLYITTDQNTWIMVVHHAVTIKLILAHLSGVLPTHLGIEYLTLFECSNWFLQLYHLFKCYGWTTAASWTIVPFVTTYVPLRVIFIPVKTFAYYASLTTLPILAALQYAAILVFVAGFSIGYGCYVFTKAWSKLKSVCDTLH